MIEEILIGQADGKELVNTLYRPDTKKAVPGVLVISDILGLGDHSRERAQRIAGLGYAALAVDLHGDGKALDVPAALAELQRFYDQPQGPLSRAKAALKLLCEQPSVDTDRLAAIGFCYGGTLSLEMLRSGLPIKAVAGFHSVLRSSIEWTPEEMNGKVLVCVGSEDPEIPADQRHAFEAEMRQTKADWQLHLYGGVYHSFTDWRSDQAGLPDFARYDAAADRRSWQAMEEMLSDALR